MENLSTVDGFYYDAAVDFGVLLGLLYCSVGFGPEGGSFKLQLFSLPVYSTRWVEEELEPDEEPKDTKPRRRRRNIRKLYEPSKILNEKYTDIFALASIKTSNWLIKRLANLDKSHKVMDGFDLDYKKKIDDIDKINNLPLVIIDSGSLGYEAISFVLASNHIELIKLIREIVNY